MVSTERAQQFIILETRQLEIAVRPVGTAGQGKGKAKGILARRVEINETVQVVKGTVNLT